MLPAPCVHQQIAGAAVEARRIAAGRKVGQVADAADIDDNAVFVRMAQHLVMERGNQRCALPSCGNIATAEIADYGNAGQLGKQCGIADLQGVVMLGAMADGLAMAANGLDFRVRQARLIQQRVGRYGVEPRQLIAGQLRPVQFIVAWLVQRQQLIFQRVVKGQVMPGKQFWLRPAQIDKDGVNAVQAGAGHQTHIQFRRVLHGISNRVLRGWCCATDSGARQNYLPQSETQLYSHCRLALRPARRRARGHVVGHRL